MEDEWIKRMQNLEILPSKRADEAFQNRIAQLPQKKNKIVWKLAASIILVSLSYFVYMTQEQGGRNVSQVNQEIKGNTNPLFVENRKNETVPNKITEPTSKNENNDIIAEKKGVEEEISKEEQTVDLNEINRTFAKIAIEKLEGISKTEVNVNNNQKLLNVEEIGFVYVGTKTSNEEEVKKGDTFVQELMLLKYGEVIDEKATIAKLFTKEDNFLYNETNEFKSRLMWVKNKLMKE